MLNRIKILGQRIRGLFFRRRLDEEFQQELDSHLEMLAEENLRRGMSPEEAQRMARVQLGGITQLRETNREMWGLPWFETLWQDLRYGLRQLRRNPGFTAVAVLTLALGIGVNAAIFNFAHAALWRTLPVADPGSLVRVVAIRQDGGQSAVPASVLADLRRNSPVFSGLTTTIYDGVSFSFNGGRAQRVTGEVVSPNYFIFLGVRPILGQGFREDVQKGRWAAEVVLSYRFWQREFHGDPNVLGRSIRLNDYPFTIVGVSPSSFYSLDVGFEPDLRLPRMPPGQEVSQINLLSEGGGETMARLKAGTGIAQAQAAVNSEWQHLMREYTALKESANPVREIRLLPGDKGWGGLAEYREPLVVLFALAGLVLLIASTNLAGMLLARATARRRELGLRAAIGAGRGRLIRQMVTESALLSAAGGLVGFAAMTRADSVLYSFFPQGNIQVTLNLRPDYLVVGYTVCLCLATILMLGLTPALQAVRSDLTATLQSESAASMGGIGGTRIRKALVVGQVMLSLLLLVTAGLLWRSLTNLRAGDVFPKPDRVLLFTIKPQVELYSSRTIRNLTAQIVTQMAELPGVKSAALAENGPLGSRSDHATVENTGGQTIEVAMDMVTPGFFEAVGLPLMAGRDFSPSDRGNSSPKVIVNQVLSLQLFGNENPLGKILRSPSQTPFRAFGATGPWEIVGVVKASRYYDLHQPAPPAIYLDLEQATAYMPTLHVRLAEGAISADVIAEVHREFNGIDRHFPVFNTKTLATRVKEALAQERLVGRLAGAFGCLAVVLVAIGLYGVMSYTVSRRIREIGIRMALGAEKSDILKMVVGQGLKLALIGVAIGIVGALALTRFLSSLLYGVKPTDPLTFIAVSLILIAVALLACYIPARRAARVDPMVALRYE